MADYRLPPHAAVCFSGHRPEKLPDGILLRMVKSMLYEEIRYAVEQGAETFYTGLARGVDLWAANIVIGMRKKHPDLKLIGVKPFPKQGTEYRGEELYIYNSIMSHADDTIHLCPQYQRNCYRLRNQYMIDHSDLLIATVANMASGTGQTIRMAEKKGIIVRRISLLDAAQPMPEI